MAEATWHAAFHPSSFLGRVRLDQFLDKHRVQRDNIKSHISPCVLCRGTTPPGLLLNNRAYLCATCFDELSRVSYPEKYERLRRDYLTTHEAWRLARSAYIETANARRERKAVEWSQARQSFSSQSPYSGMASFFGVAAVVSFFVIFAFPPGGIIGAVVAGILAANCNSAHSNRMKKWEQEHPRPDATKLDPSKPVPGWDTQNPEPHCPVLRHFHDPQAELSQRDRAVLHVFNHWPGYPPFWDYLKEVVQRRDGNRCQVTGCPSRVAIHVHHMQPTSQGGEHAPDNLVCLCAFHHGLEPEVGHERVWGDIKNRYFTLVRAHKRRNPGGHGEHYVSAHVRRLELVTPHELESIAQFHGFTCPACGNSGLTFAVHEGAREVHVNCTGCSESWTAKRALTEETGPRLAEVLTVSRNAGRWQANWEMFSERNHAVFKTQQVHKHRQGSIRATKPPPKRKRSTRKPVERPPEPVMQAVRRVTRDISRPLNAAAISHAYERGWINDWEHNFYSDIMTKRSLSDRQVLKREQINRKVLKRIK